MKAFYNPAEIVNELLREMGWTTSKPDDAIVRSLGNDKFHIWTTIPEADGKNVAQLTLLSDTSGVVIIYDIETAEIYGQTVRVANVRIGQNV